MAHDEGLAELLREDLEGTPGLTEKRMFGGLCFLTNGNMICGLYREGGMFRVGKEAMAEALAMPGAGPMEMGPRTMSGFVAAGPEVYADDALRARLLALSLAVATVLPPK